jgi:Zn-dependent M28 family amino/carboxypeptidase
VAEAFSRNSQGARRSVLFAGWDAEESGLLGSYYYVARSSFPLERTVAMLQMDMIGRDEEVPDSQDRRFQGMEQQSAEQNRNSVNVLGYSRSSDLRERVRETNRRVGLELRFRYDDHPMNLIRRSDHWPFLAHGVPVALFHTGLHPDYHRTSDTVDKLNFAKMEKVTRLVYLTAWNTADEITKPRLIP